MPFFKHNHRSRSRSGSTSTSRERPAAAVAVSEHSFGGGGGGGSGSSTASTSDTQQPPPGADRASRLSGNNDSPKSASVEVVDDPTATTTTAAAGSEGRSGLSGGTGLFRRLSSRARGRRGGGSGSGSAESAGGAVDVGGGGGGGRGDVGSSGLGSESTEKSGTTSKLGTTSPAAQRETTNLAAPVTAQHRSRSKDGERSRERTTMEASNTTGGLVDDHIDTSTSHHDGKPLSRDDVQALFSGAPHFTLEAGRRHRSFPQAFFPFAAGLNITDLQDRIPFSHQSFALSTLHSHLPVPTLSETGKSTSIAPTVPVMESNHSITRDSTEFVTTGLQHINLDASSDSTTKEHTAPPSRQMRARPMFDLSIYERPNMLSMHGIEPGTFGYHAFLERGVADGLDAGREDMHKAAVDNTDTKSNTAPDEVDALQRKTATEALRAMGHDAAAETGLKIGKHAPPVDRIALLQEGPKAWKRIGVREISLKTITERLALISELREEVVSKGWHYTVIQKLGEEELGLYLFEELLFEPSSHSSRPGKGVEPGSKGRALKMQIELLVKILTTPGAWLDFSLPKERILFALSLHTREIKLENDLDHKGITTASKRWLSLVQLLLAVELVIRLDAALRLGIAMHSEDVEVSSAEIHRFNKLRNLKVDWDFVVARRFLDLCYVRKVPLVPHLTTQAAKEHSSGRGLLDRLRHGSHEAITDHTWPFECAVLPRDPVLMIDGLLRFARDIGWDPASVEDISKQLDRKLRSRSHEEREQMLAKGVEVLDHSHVPQHTRDRGKVELRAASEDTLGGPLTHAWIRALVFPGWYSCDLLMCALLENDVQQQAVAKLGNVGYPRMGFVLSNRSWWSKLCVLSGVLAPASEAKERMGWIGLPETLTPIDSESGQPFPDGWIMVVSEALVDQHAERRIFGGDDLAKQSSTLGVGKGHVQANEFRMLTDKDLDGGIELHIDEVMLVLQQQDEQSSDGQPVYEAAVLTSIREGATTLTKKQVVLTRLQYTVRFVSAHPCQVPHGHTRLHSLTESRDGGPFAEQKQQQTPLRHKRLETLPSHPLHQSFKYVVRSLADLLAETDDVPTPTGEESNPVWIIDARGGWEREVLARAWAAQVGRHAIVSRVGLACLGCSVREARALSVAVIIRVTR